MEEIATALNSEKGLAFGMLIITAVALWWAVRGWMNEKDKRADEKDKHAARIAELAQDGIQAQHAMQNALMAFTALVDRGSK